MSFIRTAFFLLLGTLAAATSWADDRPNILWVTSEDNGPQLGCYGDAYAVTPNIDALAEKSLRYKRCWSNAPVCAPARTTLIAGMYATSLGAEHMRSGVRLPADVTLYPHVLRDAGYYCTNHTKTDYNFADADAGWHDSSKSAHWRNRPSDDTPFFAVFNFTVSHESKIRTRPHQQQHDPAKAPLPAYHPDTPEVRQDWAQYYDKLTEMDAEVGRILRELEQDGLADSTIVFYYGDHGSGMPRSKRWPFDSGLRVPLLLHVPERYQQLAPPDYTAGAESTRLVSFVDLGPTAISLAGAEVPSTMQGVPFAGAMMGPSKEYLFGYRGRMDERVDMVRTCTDGRYVYMRHFYPERPYLKHVDYMFQTPTTRVWKQLFDAGKLNEAQAKFWQPKPVEELFDLHSDPDEVDNLAGSAEHADQLAQMRQAVRDWMVETRDLGLLPEAELHRLAGERSPRELALSGDLDFSQLTSVAFAAMDVDSEMTIERLAALATNDNSGIRFWAVRGLAIRAGDGGGARDEALKVALQDPSPSVAIAAADGLLRSDQRQLQRQAIERLIQLADVEQVGHFAAVEALNVLDMNAKLSEADRVEILALPLQVAKPPVRVGGYVARLMDHLEAEKKGK